MLKVQNQPQVQVNNSLSFKSRNEFTSPIDDYEPDNFSKEDIEADRDKKLDDIEQQQQQLNDIADELEKNDNKFSKKAGKVFRFGATLLGIVGTFVVSKYSSKLAIESIKSAAKNPSVQKVLESAKGLKEPAMKLVDSSKEVLNKFMESPKAKEVITKITDSNIVKTTKAFLENEKVAKIIEPLKNTIKSIKDTKINGSKIQSAIENTMAATTTGSVIVDNLTGRNNDKSVVDLATAS